MNLGQVRSIAVLAVCLFGSLPSQCSQEIQLDSIEKLELHHLKADIVTYRGRTAVRVANTGALDFDYSEGIAIVHEHRSGTARLRRPFLATPRRMLRRNCAVSLGSHSV